MQANNGLYRVLKVRCALKSLTGSCMLTGKYSILYTPSSNRYCVKNFGIVSNSEGVDVYLDNRNSSGLQLQDRLEICGILLLHWVKKIQLSRRDEEILLQNVPVELDSSNVPKSLSTRQTLIEAVQFDYPSLPEYCSCKDMNRRVNTYNKKVRVLSQTAGKHQGLSRRRLEEFYHG